jgi:hypothetical protein
MHDDNSVAAQLGAHELDLQNAPMSRENKELEVSAQHIHTESVDSQKLHRQLELSRAREQNINWMGKVLLLHAGKFRRLEYSPSCSPRVAITNLNLESSWPIVDLPGGPVCALLCVFVIHIPLKRILGWRAPGPLYLPIGLGRGAHGVDKSLWHPKEPKSSAGY